MRVEEISDEKFRQVLQACPVPIRELADQLSVSRPTVERWLMGKNLPGQVIREVIVKYLTSVGEVGSTPTANG